MPSRPVPAFAGYLRLLAATNPAPLPRAEQLAFWINAYNAYTIQLINAKNEREIHPQREQVARLPANSKDRGPRHLPWSAGARTRSTTSSSAPSAPRSASRGFTSRWCAPRSGARRSASEAYTGARLEAQLNDQAVMFLTQTPAKNRVDVATRTVYRSQVFSFSDYMNDFGGSEATVGRFIARYYPAGPRRRCWNLATSRR